MRVINIVTMTHCSRVGRLDASRAADLSLHVAKMLASARMASAAHDDDVDLIDGAKWCECERAMRWFDQCTSVAWTDRLKNPIFRRGPPEGNAIFQFIG